MFKTNPKRRNLTKGEGRFIYTTFTTLMAILLFTSYAHAGKFPILKKVATPEVCMITNKHMGAAQIAVPIGKKVYYGCCEMCVGTLNNWQDRDRCWTAEMAMSIKDLTARGERFGPDGDWRILVARYNYSYHLAKKGPELSSSPRLSTANYHLLDEYAVLKLAK